MYLTFTPSPSPPGPCLLTDSPKLKSECSSPSLEHGLPHGHPGSLCVPTLTGLSICPSIRGGSQWPPSAARNFSSNCCRAVSCLLPSRALIRSGCSLPSASPAGSSGGLVSACRTRCQHRGRITHTTFIHPKPHFNLLHLAMPSRTPTCLAHHMPAAQVPFYYTTSRYAQSLHATPHQATSCHDKPHPSVCLGFWDSRKLSFLDLGILKCLHPKVTSFWDADVSYGIPKYHVTEFGHSDK